MPDVVTAPRPVASDFDYDQRRAIRAWLAANGIPNYGVMAIELLTIDAPMVAVTRKLTEQGGGPALIDRATGRIATETTDHLVRVPHPPFWQPRQTA